MCRGALNMCLPWLAVLISRSDSWFSAYFELLARIQDPTKPSVPKSGWGYREGRNTWLEKAEARLIPSSSRHRHTHTHTTTVGHTMYSCTMHQPHRILCVILINSYILSLKSVLFIYTPPSLSHTLPVSNDLLVCGTKFECVCVCVFHSVTNIILWFATGR